MFGLLISILSFFNLLTLENANADHKISIVFINETPLSLPTLKDDLNGYSFKTINLKNYNQIDKFVKWLDAEDAYKQSILNDDYIFTYTKKLIQYSHAVWYQSLNYVAQIYPEGLKISEYSKYPIYGVLRYSLKESVLETNIQTKSLIKDGNNHKYEIGIVSSFDLLSLKKSILGGGDHPYYKEFKVESEISPSIAGLSELDGYGCKLTLCESQECANEIFGGILDLICERESKHVKSLQESTLTVIISKSVAQKMVHYIEK